MSERWTVPTIRKHLGERGFLQEEPSIIDHDKGITYSSFTRDEDELTLVEYHSGEEPVVTQHGKQVLVKDIGFRNEQIQHDKLKGD